MAPGLRRDATQRLTAGDVGKIDRRVFGPEAAAIRGQTGFR